MYKTSFTAAGTYSIEVINDCTAVPCSPFTSKAYDACAITCGPVPLGFVDKPVEFHGTYRLVMGHYTGFSASKFSEMFITVISIMFKLN